MQGLACFSPFLFSLPRLAERPIHCKVTLNRSQQEGLKTDMPFCGCPPISLLAARTQADIFPPQETRHGVESQEGGRRKEIKHFFLLIQSDRSLMSQQDSWSSRGPKGTSIMHQEQAADRGQPFCDWMRELGAPQTVRKSRRGCSGKQSVQAKYRLQSTEPKTKGVLVENTDRQRYRREKLAGFFMLQMWGGCRDCSCCVKPNAKSPHWNMSFVSAKTSKQKRRDVVWLTSKMIYDRIFLGFCLQSTC